MTDEDREPYVWRTAAESRTRSGCHAFQAFTEDPRYDPPNPFDGPRERCVLVIEVEDA